MSIKSYSAQLRADVKAHAEKVSIIEEKHAEANPEQYLQEYQLQVAAAEYLEYIIDEKRNWFLPTDKLRPNSRELSKNPLFATRKGRAAILNELQNGSLKDLFKRATEECAQLVKQNVIKADDASAPLLLQEVTKGEDGLSYNIAVDIANFIQFEELLEQSCYVSDDQGLADVDLDDVFQRKAIKHNTETLTYTLWDQGHKLKDNGLDILAAVAKTQAARTSPPGGVSVGGVGAGVQVGGFRQYEQKQHPVVDGKTVTFSLSTPPSSPPSSPTATLRSLGGGSQAQTQPQAQASATPVVQVSHSLYPSPTPPAAAPSRLKSVLGAFGNPITGIGNYLGFGSPTAPVSASVAVPAAKGKSSVGFTGTDSDAFNWESEDDAFATVQHSAPVGSPSAADSVSATAAVSVSGTPVSAAETPTGRISPALRMP